MHSWQPVVDRPSCAIPVQPRVLLDGPKPLGSIVSGGTACLPPGCSLAPFDPRPTGVCGVARCVRVAAVAQGVCMSGWVVDPETMRPVFEWDVGHVKGMLVAVYALLNRVRVAYAQGKRK